MRISKSHGFFDAVLIECTLRILLPGLQKLDGIQGNLVIRTPKSTDRNGNTYDVDVTDHTLMILDWMKTTAEIRFQGSYKVYPDENQSLSFSKAEGVLRYSAVRLLKAYKPSTAISDTY